MDNKKSLVNKLFARFFLPALFSSLALAVGALADTFYIGSKIGQNGLFIIGAASPVYAIVSTISLGMASGGAVHFSQALGEGKEKEAKHIFFSTIFWDFVFILIIMGLGLGLQKYLMQVLGADYSVEMYRSYVRAMLIASPILFMQAPLQFFVYADGDPILSSVALVCGSIVDVLSGYILIVHFNMGPVASVYATLIGAIVMELICLTHLFKKRGCLNFKGLGSPSIKLAFKSFFTGFSTAIVYFYQFLTILIFNRILLVIAGEWAVAGYDIVYNLVLLVMAITEALGMAIGTLVSTFFAEKNLKGCKGTLGLASMIGLGLTLIFVVLLMFFSTDLCHIFGVSEEYVELTRLGLNAYLMALIFASMNGVFASYFQSVNHEKFAYLITFLRSFGVLLLSGILLSYAGYKYFTYSFLIAEVSTFLVSLPVLLKVNIFKHDDSKVYSDTLVGSADTISHLTEKIEHFLQASDVDFKRSYFISLSVDETLNLITANKDNVFLDLTLIVNEGNITLHIRDNAKAFNIFELSEDEEVGLRIIKKSTKSFHYREFVGFNTLTIQF